MESDCWPVALGPLSRGPLHGCLHLRVLTPVPRLPGGSGFTHFWEVSWRKWEMPEACSFPIGVLSALQPDSGA